MDGTVVDTEPYWLAAERRLVEEFGGRWTEQDAMALIGNSLMVSADHLREHAGVDLEPVEIVHRLQQHVIDEVSRVPHWRPGARELLAQCQAAGVPCALVTMSWTPLAAAVVDQLPAGTFTHVVTGDQVTRGKPHPEPYLTAMDRLGVEAFACVALEDSPPGVASALASGAVTVAVPNLVPIPEAPGLRVLPTLAGVDLTDLARLVTPGHPDGTGPDHATHPSSLC